MKTIFAKRLRELREKKGLYQQDIADELKITMQAVSSWERGIQEPSIESILKLCELLKTTPNYLIGFDPEPPSGYEFEYEGNGTKLTHRERKK